VGGKEGMLCIKEEGFGKRCELRKCALPPFFRMEIKEGGRE